MELKYVKILVNFLYDNGYYFTQVFTQNDKNIVYKEELILRLNNVLGNEAGWMNEIVYMHFENKKIIFTFDETPNGKSQLGVETLFRESKLKRILK